MYSVVIINLITRKYKMYVMLNEGFFHANIKSSSDLTSLHRHRGRGPEVLSHSMWVFITCLDLRYCPGPPPIGWLEILCGPITVAQRAALGNHGCVAVFSKQQ